MTDNAIVSLKAKFVLIFVVRCFEGRFDALV
jgi:hypothetical protein